MSPPLSGLNLDIEALSGICGSISIACWVVVFSPQIIENFRRSSADGLSLIFVIVWLLGDIFNILGAVLQGVLPTMTILAVYYTLADIVLLGQRFYYRGFTLSDAPAHTITPTMDEEAVEGDPPTEQSSLLPHKRPSNTPARPTISDAAGPSAHGSFSSLRSHLSSSHLDATHLSPATPFTPPKTSPLAAESMKKPKSTLYTLSFDIGALILVCAAGVLGWWLSFRSSRAQYPDHYDNHHHDRHRSPLSTDDTLESLHFDLWGQIFGYFCAVLYLGSRIPQILLNYRRKSTEGVSMLFFLFACVGNLTYVMSIFAYEPGCARFENYDDVRSGCESGEWARGYGQYILLNASWLIGSAGTLLLDLMIFGQFWIYRDQGWLAGLEVVPETKHPHQRHLSSDPSTTQQHRYTRPQSHDNKTRTPNKHRPASLDLMATRPAPTTLQTPATPQTQPLQAALSTPSPGSWRHPRSDEIARRQKANTFDDSNVRKIVWNAVALVALFYVSSHPWIQTFQPLTTPILLLVYLLGLYNIATALSPLVNNTDELTDIPLTPTQRSLLGLDPNATPPLTPGTQYITPPRYPRSPTPRNISPATRSASNYSTPITRSPSFGREGSDSPTASLAASPLWQKSLGRSRDTARRSSYGSPSFLGPGWEGGYGGAEQ
ncbi:MAG: hypothetical protein ASARMPREDX12_006446 [Alectoria sarmentosa]|nr:MAG: hypothetical protein ASARMPREDX12_006446 [Alectoria sarmentosa]